MGVKLCSKWLSIRHPRTEEKSSIPQVSTTNTQTPKVRFTSTRMPLKCQHRTCPRRTRPKNSWCFQAQVAGTSIKHQARPSSNVQHLPPIHSASWTSPSQAPSKLKMCPFRPEATVAIEMQKTWGSSKMTTFYFRNWKKFIQNNRMTCLLPLKIWSLSSTDWVASPLRIIMRAVCRLSRRSSRCCFWMSVFRGEG